MLRVERHTLVMTFFIFSLSVQVIWYFPVVCLECTKLPRCSLLLQNKEIENGRIRRDGGDSGDERPVGPPYVGVYKIKKGNR